MAEASASSQMAAGQLAGFSPRDHTSSRSGGGGGGSSSQLGRGGTPSPAAADVHLVDEGNYVKLENGIVEVIMSKPGGIVTGIRYGEIDNLLEVLNTEINRGYWDLNWSLPNGSDIFDVIIGTQYKVIDASPEKVEVSFVRKYNPSSNEMMVPLNIDKRFVLLRGDAGFYSYGIYEHLGDWMDFDLNQTRIAFKLRKDRFQYMAMDDSKQRIMPSPDDRLPSRSQPLCYPEAVLLLRPENPILEGEVDDKYQYSCENRINRVHGWLSMKPLIGFWIITPSFEFRNGGITKQNLTSHVGPTSLSVFHSGHYAGTPLYAQFRNGESWKKVFGPIRIYLNSAEAGSLGSDLWEDAKQQLLVETQAWPYNWPSSKDYPKAGERGTITGKLLVQDRFVSPTMLPAAYAVLGLAGPGDAGSWQIESKGYQFWSEADIDGYFTISNIRPGTYSLYGWVPNVLGDYKKDGIINVQSGALDLGNLIYEPPRDGRTVWEIGTPDRTAKEFFIPEPKPQYINKLFVNHPESYRQYGLWLQYSENYPDGDLTYTIGKSDPSSDWFFAHVCRIKDDGTLQPTTWQIIFQLDKVLKTGAYKFRIALASASVADIQVRVNDPTASSPLFEIVDFGRDNAIARHGIHGLYHLFTIDISPELLQEGENIIYLTQANTKSCLVGVMYDYLRLEEPKIEV